MAELLHRVERPGLHTVYNLEISGEHRYYVSSVGVLVHNGCGETGTKIKDLLPLDGPGHSAPRPGLQKLSDDELLNAARNPVRRDPLTRSTATGRLQDCNGRAYELQRRAADPNSRISPDDVVPVENYTPDNSMFPDLD